MDTGRDREDERHDDDARGEPPRQEIQLLGGQQRGTEHGTEEDAGGQCQGRRDVLGPTRGAVHDHVPQDRGGQTDEANRPGPAHLVARQGGQERQHADHHDRDTHPPRRGARAGPATEHGRRQRRVGRDRHARVPPQPRGVQGSLDEPGAEEHTGDAERASHVDREGTHVVVPTTGDQHHDQRDDRHGEHQRGERSTHGDPDPEPQRGLPVRDGHELQRHVDDDGGHHQTHDGPEPALVDRSARSDDQGVRDREQDAGRTLAAHEPGQPVRREARQHRRQQEQHPDQELGGEPHRHGGEPQQQHVGRGERQRRQTRVARATEDEVPPAARRARGREEGAAAQAWRQGARGEDCGDRQQDRGGEPGSTSPDRGTFLELRLLAVLGVRGVRAAADRLGGLGSDRRANGLDQAVPRVLVGLPPRGEQVGDVLVAAASRGLTPAARLLQAAGVEVEGAQRQQLVGGALRVPADELTHEAQQGTDEQAHVLPGEPPGGHVRQHREHLSPATLVVRRVAGTALADASPTGLGVEHDRTGRGADAMSGTVGAPPEVQVVGEQRELGVESAELVPHVAAHQHAGGVDRQHVLGPVVLTRVGLPGLEPGLARGGARDREADLQQAAQRGPLADLRTHDRDVVGRGGLVEQTGQGAGSDRDVVVEQPDPVGPGQLRQPEPDRLSEARAGGRVRDALGAEGPAQQLGRTVRGADVDRVPGGGSVVQTGQGRQDLGEPGRAVMADQDRGDRGGTAPPRRNHLLVVHERRHYWTSGWPLRRAS